MKKAFPALLLFLGAVTILSGASRDELAGRINTILGKRGLRRVLFSVRIVSCGSGEVVYERNPHLTLLPASNMKIVTSAAALEHLGPGFAFVTRVGLCGDTLVVIGSGDPLLGNKEKSALHNRNAPNVIQAIIARLLEMNIKSISGIILDTSVFDGQGTHPSWPQNQLHQKYACEVSGLNYNGNCLDITAFNKKGKIILTLDPPTGYIQLINELSPGAWRQNFFSVARTDVPGQLLVRGKCAKQAGPYSVAVENPALFFGRLLEESLSRAGISVGGRARLQTFSQDDEFLPVVDFRTSITDCLQLMNKESLGLAAEAVFKTLGRRANPDGKLGSWEGGSRVLSDFLRNIGVADEDFVIADGSGLSRDNRLSAAAIVRVLAHLSSGPHWEIFKSSLAVGGLDGTIESHFWEKKYRGRVLAKSGYIQAVRALSGIVTTDSGDCLFSFLSNLAGNEARSAIDASVKAILEWGERKKGF